MVGSLEIFLGQLSTHPKKILFLTCKEIRRPLGNEKPGFTFLLTNEMPFTRYSSFS
jgi:hypothetical protein